ncbi:MAG: hypothetical protein A3F14_04815 [Gammaproteobacteria bacterium RIFCSPHIGHO2_12_FULL_43_28]|nr:MAG: hypothetical protein A3F14_04815 [Gammaproteobacteria bacterium RIFCSPHIGHO2_12_FULL_43_28]
MPLPLAFILPVILLTEGFASIAIEVLTIRQLLPVAGGSIIVTSLVIGFFLLSLAIGYQQGGKQHRHPRQVLRRNFFIAACWLGIGLSYVFILLFFYSIEKLLGSHILYPLIIYLFLIIAPLVYLLGQTIPIAMNMVKQTESAGKIGGNALGLSTLGSFLGATLTTLFLMYYFGVGTSVLITSLLLFLLTLLLTETRAAFLLQLFLISIATMIIYEFNTAFEKKIFLLTDPYANYQIITAPRAHLSENEKILMINEAPSSYINAAKKTFPYNEKIKQVLFNELKLRRANILILGAGGFTLSAENTYQNTFTYVDIDKSITKAVIPHFMQAINGSFIADDARHFVKSTDKYYDAIVIDAYTDTKAIPSYLLTQEYMMDIKSRLATKGTAIFNILANPQLTDLYSKHVDNTIRAVFKNCMVLPEHYTNQITNILYLCSNSLNQADTMVYKDNFNHSTTDAFYW